MLRYLWLFIVLITLVSSADAQDSARSRIGIGIGIGNGTVIEVPLVYGSYRIHPALGFTISSFRTSTPTNSNIAWSSDEVGFSLEPTVGIFYNKFAATSFAWYLGPTVG